MSDATAELLGSLPTATDFLELVLADLAARPRIEIREFDTRRPIVVRRHFVELTDKITRSANPLGPLARLAGGSIYSSWDPINPGGPPSSIPSTANLSQTWPEGTIRVYRPGPDNIGDVRTIDQRHPHCERGLEEPGTYLHFHIALAAGPA